MSSAHTVESIGIFEDVPVLQDSVNNFLVQSVIVMGLCAALGSVGAYMKQPMVIFEIVAGILIGPSAIGRNVDFATKIWSKASLNYINLASSVGLILYLFLVGMELDPKLLLSHMKSTSGVAFFGMAVPFVLGIGISSTMFQNLQAGDPKFKDVSPTSFFVFIGTAMSITAFPVLARILKETGLIYTRPGAMTMGAAAINDAIAWCLLILAVSFGNAGGDQILAFYVFLTVCGLAFTLFFIVRPLWCMLVKWAESFHSPRVDKQMFALTIMCVFTCAFITSFLGVHYIFGAFLWGLIMPRDSQLFTRCNEHIEELVLSFLLPLYFALSGIKTDITQINSWSQGSMVLLVCFIATVGKFIGAGFAARLSGMGNRESCVVAVLMNARGLVELIVLNLGLTAGILNTSTFSVMVLMCLFTTFITNPLVELIYPPHLRGAVAKRSTHERDSDEKPDEVEMIPKVDLAELSRDLKLGVLIDKLDDTQGLISVLSFFAPVTAESALGVTVIHAIEPSNTEDDDFIGKDERGRLLEVQSVPTTHKAALLAARNRSIKNPSDLLPVSMFFHTFGSEVSVFRMRGDPMDFPSEIVGMSKRFNMDLLALPWRDSDFVTTLFWGSLRSVVHPILLVVPLQALVKEREINNMTRQRTDTSDSTSVKRPAEFTRQRSLTVKHIFAPTEDNDDDNVDENSFDVSIKTALAVVTGSAMDVELFNVVSRVAERDTTTVKVFVTNDKDHFPISVTEELRYFEQQVAAKANVSMIYGNSSTADMEGLVDEITGIGTFDAIMYSIDKASYSGSKPQQPRDASPLSRRATRSNSISEALAQALAPMTEMHEHRRILGMPDFAAFSPLAHPELGGLGNKMFAPDAFPSNRLAKFLLIVEEPMYVARMHDRTSFSTVAESFVVDNDSTSQMV